MQQPTKDTTRTKNWRVWLKRGIEPIVSCPQGRKCPVRNERHKKGYEKNESNRTSESGKEQLSQRAEKAERSFRHLLDYGRVRRTTLTGRARISKRTLISGFAFNLSIFSWHVHGYGTAKQYTAGNRNPEALFWIFGLKKHAGTAMAAFKKLWIAFGLNNRIFEEKIRLIRRWRKTGDSIPIRIGTGVFQQSPRQPVHFAVYASQMLFYSNILPPHMLSGYHWQYVSSRRLSAT